VAFAVALLKAYISHSRNILSVKRLLRFALRVITWLVAVKGRITKSNSRMHRRTKLTSTRLSPLTHIAGLSGDESELWSLYQGGGWGIGWRIPARKCSV